VVDDEIHAGVPLLAYPARVRVLCVGGGPVAADKLRALLDGGAQVTVIAPQAVAALRTAATAGQLRWSQRTYQRGDIADAHLVIAATDSAAVNAAVAADADMVGCLCVRVDREGAGSAAFMGAIRRGPVIFGVSTSGLAPGFTRALRDDLAHRYGPEYGALATLWAQLRHDQRVITALAPLDAKRRRERWRGVYDSDILGHIRAGNLNEAKEAAFACLLSSSD
jgi:precorrin-2 dehydrogenase